MALSSPELNIVRALVLRRSGIVLDEGKGYLVEARLTGLARKLGFDSISALIAKIAAPGGAAAERAVVDAMTTNETTFFRDVAPFEALKKTVMPALIARRCAERRLAIWCAASSTGQEPYTLAMVIREHFPHLSDWQITFVASDLSRDVLERARAGRYSQLEVNRGLPATFLIKYFKKQGLEWEIAPEIRKMVDFREVNLLETWPAMPPLDLVFIRNVLIYFSPETKKQILQRLRSTMKPDGYLFLGAAETTTNLDDRFARCPLDKSGCYQLRISKAA